jgi:hypothetical protein
MHAILLIFFSIEYFKVTVYNSHYGICPQIDFEGYVAAEIIKRQIGSGKAKALYYLQDQQGLEVNFIVPAGDQHLLFVEAKASGTVPPAMAQPLERLAGANKHTRSPSILSIVKAKKISRPQP